MGRVTDYQVTSFAGRPVAHGALFAPYPTLFFIILIYVCRYVYHMSRVLMEARRGCWVL